MHSVDDVYDAFVRSLPAREREAARALPRTLLLASRPVPWSRVFPEPVTLHLPLLLLDALPPVPPDLLTAAMTSHVLSVIHAYADDHVRDRQVILSARAASVVDALAAARDRAQARLGPAPATPLRRHALAHQVAARAIADEHALLAASSSATFDDYERLSQPKQYPGLPATLQLAAAAGMPEARIASLGAMIVHAALAVQLADDVFDWEEDAALDASWAVRLTPAAPRRGSIDAQREALHAAGTLVTMLRRARAHAITCRELARGLGARHVLDWAEARSRAWWEVAEHEARAPGYGVCWYRERRRAQESASDDGGDPRVADSAP